MVFDYIREGVAKEPFSVTWTREDLEGGELGQWWAIQKAAYCERRRKREPRTLPTRRVAVGPEGRIDRRNRLRSHATLHRGRQSLRAAPCGLRRAGEDPGCLRVARPNCKGGGGVETIRESVDVLKVRVPGEAPTERLSDLAESAEHQERCCDIQPGTGRVGAEVQLLEELRRFLTGLERGRCILAQEREVPEIARHIRECGTDISTTSMNGRLLVQLGGSVDVAGSGGHVRQAAQRTRQIGVPTDRAAYL